MNVPSETPGKSRKHPPRWASARLRRRTTDMTTLLNELIETGDVIELVRGDES
jgi:hypothetical protein